jgi:hypothetical protein
VIDSENAQAGFEHEFLRGLPPLAVKLDNLACDVLRAFVGLAALRVGLIGRTSHATD